MSSTKTLGKLISGCISDVSSRELWDNFTVAHRNLFIENGNGGVQDALFGLGKELSALLANQYAPGIQAKFMFEMPDTSSFLKSGYVSISNGNNGEDETDLANKGTGLQRAFMLALLQLYARKSTGGFDKPHRITFGLDEPETWLHPRAQIKLIEAVRKISERQQVLLVTHSPYMLQNFNPDDSAVIIFGDNQNGGRTFTYTELNKCKLPYISWNAINYYVFGVPSVEFMDELYGHFQNKVSENKGSMFERDIIKELNNQGVKSTEKWKKEKMSKDRKTKILEESIVPLCVYVRNSVHHPENRNNDKYTVDQLLGAIKELESVLEES